VLLISTRRPSQTYSEVEQTDQAASSEEMPRTQQAVVLPSALSTKETMNPPAWLRYLAVVLAGSGAGLVPGERLVWDWGQVLEEGRGMRWSVH